MTNDLPNAGMDPSVVELSADLGVSPFATPTDRYAFTPLPATCGWNEVLSALLRQPGRIIYQLHEPAGVGRVCVVLALVAVLCLAAYGLVVGDFSGAEQLWAAPLKITIGSILAAAICTPSLYVLACLGGAHEKLKFNSLVGLLLATIALNALLLVSFAPIAWVFSQSTDSLAFISNLHLLLWAVGFYFGLRLLYAAARFLGIVDRGYLLLWMMIFTLVSLQMMTTLRPIVGRSDRFLPSEKQFFLAHWLELYNLPTR